MHQCYARAASIEDALLLAPRLRQADVDEIGAHSGHEPLRALVDGIHNSQWSLAICHDETRHVLALCGVGHHPEVPDVGFPWMLASDGLLGVQQTFLRHSRAVIARMQADYPVLTNWVDARNAVHIRWLRWCGFRFIRLHPVFGHERRPFYEFARIACVN